jgi:hypothetical protein
MITGMVTRSEGRIRLKIWPQFQAIAWKSWQATEKVNIVFASTINGGFVFAGAKGTPMMWKSLTTTERMPCHDVN